MSTTFVCPKKEKMLELKQFTRRLFLGSFQFELPKNYMGDILTFDMYTLLLLYIAEDANRDITVQSIKNAAASVTECVQFSPVSVLGHAHRHTL